MISRMALRTDPVIARMNYRNSAEVGHTARTLWGVTLGCRPLMKTKCGNSLLRSNWTRGTGHVRKGAAQAI